MPVTTTNTSMPDWVQPYAQGYLDQGMAVASKPYQPYTGETVAGFTPWQQQGLEAMANRAYNGSPVLAAAQGAATNIMSGGGQGQAAGGGSAGYVEANPYAGNNPYLGQQIDLATGDMTRAWNQVQMPGFDTAMSKGGSFGNANIISMAQQGASDLQRNIGDMAGTMRFKDYTTQQQLAENALNRKQQVNLTNASLAESAAGRADSMFNNNQNRVLTALGLAPSLAAADYTDIDRLMAAGRTVQNQNQLQLDDAYNLFKDSRDYDANNLKLFGDVLKGTNFGSNTTSNTTADQPNGVATGLGGALTFAQLWNLINKP